MTVTDSSGRLALIDDSPVILETVGAGLEEMGWTVHRALGGRSGIDRIDDVVPDVVVCDLHMPEVDGLAVLDHVREHHPHTLLIVLSGDADLTAVLGAVRKGAFDYVVKTDQDLRPLGEAVRRAFEHRQLQRQNELLQADLDSARDRLASQLNELNRQHDLLRKEQEKSEALLLNILPRSIADQLKDVEHDRLIADEFEQVTVMFADLVGFTPLSGTLTPEALVTMLNGLFTKFDELAEELGVEKIKTLGDAYMAATGLPLPMDEHAEVMALMALRMVETLHAYNREHDIDLNLRIGLHSGKVVAGVIGKNKFIYDLWGDTVNIASRMESHGVPGSIQISESSQALLKDRFRTEPRGEIEVKGKGQMSTWLLTGLA